MTISVDKRAEIIFYHGAQKNPKKIAELVGVSIRIVKFWTTRWDRFKTIEQKQIQGRPRKITGENEQKMLDVIKADSLTSNEEIREKIKVDCHRTTVSRSLKRHGIRAFRAKKKPRLHPLHKRARRRFCRKVVQEKNDPNSMVFSDEKPIYMKGSSKGTIWVKRRRGDKDDKNYFVQVERKGRRLNFWSYVTKEGVGPLCLIPNRFNQVLYKQTLESTFPDLIRLKRGQKFSFIQDNARFHTTASVMNYLEPLGEQNNFDVPKLPARSPDINIIENCWSELDRLVAKAIKEIGMPSHWESYVLLCQECWMNISQEFIDSLYASYYKRCAEILAKKGGHIDY